MADSFGIIYPPVQEAAPSPVKPVLQAVSGVICESELEKNACRQQDLCILDFKFAHLGGSKTGDLDSPAMINLIDENYTCVTSVTVVNY
jgi:hypothetical protein